MAYKAVYKCRLCGERFYGGGNPRTEDCARNALLKFIFYREHSNLSDMAKHECAGRYAGSIGIADLQGMMKEKKNVPTDNR